MKSKVIFFFILSTLFFVMGCEDKYKNSHVIPYTPIDTRVNLWMADFEDLKLPGQPVYIRYSTPGGKPLGYNDNGIIVIKTDEENYKCYDATCTNCIEADTHIEITKGDQVGKCPNCQTEFFLPYGIPLDKTDEEDHSVQISPLKEYPVVVTNNTLIIRY